MVANLIASVVFKRSKPASVQKIHRRAAVFFESIVQSSDNYDIYSPSVLQGFSCGAVKTLNYTKFIQLVQAMKGKGAVLDESQLSCMAFRLTSQRTPSAIDTFPVDVLLYLNSTNFRKSRNCKTFFKGVGKSNIDILPKGSVRRQTLLEDAGTCLEITGNLTKESVSVLGGLVCDLAGSVITESDISVLDALKYCISYSEEQKSAIETLLKSGDSSYGAPSSWSSSTIRNLGNLPLTLTDTWNQVNRVVLNEALPRFIKKIKRLKPPSEVLTFINQLNIQKDSDNIANCTAGKIAAENINDLIPAIYDAAQLNLCLSDLVLDNNVLQLGALAFDPAQLEVLKNRLLQIYPNGLPEDQIQLLGNISTMFSAIEMSSWNITQVETLHALMNQQLENTTVKSIIARYLQLDGNLNAVSLKAIGGANLCILNESQLMTISNFTDAGALDLSMCTQSKKNLLYSQALSALESQQSNPIPYFHLIRPYLGGIPLDDLITLANNEVNMDFATFTSLNPQEVKNLSAQNLIDLLGYNLQALQSAVNETVVRVWVNSHFESEVRKLGLTGGIPDPTIERIFCADKNRYEFMGKLILCIASEKQPPLSISAVNNFLTDIRPGQFCSFNITDYACAKTDFLISSNALLDIFDCFLGPNAQNTSAETALIIFLQKFDENKLNKALDMFNSMTLNTSAIPLMTKITFMNALWEIVKTNENLTSPAFLAKWFQERFRPFIAGISQSVLINLARNVTCDGYPAVVKGLLNGLREMPEETRTTVLQVWIHTYLNTTAFALNCYENNNFVHFLKSSLPRFAHFLTLKDVFALVPPDRIAEVLNSVDPSELAKALSRPGFINDNESLIIILIHIQPIQNLAILIDQLVIESQESNHLTVVIEGIQLEFSKSLSGLSHTEVNEWLNVTLIPSLPLITTALFTSNTSLGLPCLLFEKIVSLLSFFKQQQNTSDQEAIYENILTYAKAFPLHCYENSTFVVYLKSYFQGFSNFLTLKDAFSLVPPDRVAEELNRIDPRELADLLSRPGFIDDFEILAVILINIKPIENLGLFVEEFIKTQDVSCKCYYF
uniref:uncharacterized protein n=1 Tax=Pristiophorus japonicus TaxID=55135 RepID=UPI00398EEF85